MHILCPVGGWGEGSTFLCCSGAIKEIFGELHSAFFQPYLGKDFLAPGPSP